MGDEIHYTDQLEKLLEAIRLEKQHDAKEYDEAMKSSSIKSRVALGRCWHPLEILEKGITVGDYPYVILKRHTDGVHFFRSGQAVSMFSSYEDEEKTNGVVNYVKKDTMKVILHANEFPSFINDGKIGIDMVFDEKTFQEMEEAIKQAMDSSNENVKRFNSIFSGAVKANFNEIHPISIERFNDSQNKALNHVLSAEHLAIVHGPPGTGKTTLITESVVQLLKKEKQILVTAPSNAAVDLLATKLKSRDVNVVRVGNLSRIDEDVLKLTPEYLVSQSANNKEIKKLKKQADELHRMALKYKRNFGREEREQRKLLITEAKSMRRDAFELEDEILDKVLNDAQVICTTLVGASNWMLKERQFKTVVIDEAAQSLEPSCWIPLVKSSKLILAGDPFQLPPTVKSMEARKAELEVSLMEKLIKDDHENVMLNVQYRMNSDIMQFSSEYFYKGELQADGSVTDHHIGDSQPFEFVDTAGTGYEEERESEDGSTFNTEEAQLLRRHFESMVIPYDATVGIISPYRAQVDKLKELISETDKIKISTVDSFQGQEKDVIYVSMVRSNGDGEIGFLKDYRRMNVAMTRAKKKLVLIGDSGTIGNDSFYEQMLNYAESIGSYKTAWEFIS